ncbi:TorD/DmsD family molecular chaperone [Halobaculum litoreum]|uniref:Molecular chaperone n=1 Tax=Halobaculum litoreum TaxID=3031998 RepID=A0ABD5XRC8_9EURY|nr:molecular chaperone TorD family protein [Halobaculum sp. DT92]
MHDTTATDQATTPDGGTATAGGSDPPAHERHGARAAVYAALAAVFQFPEESVVAELTAPETDAGLAAAGETLGLAPEVDALREALAAADGETLRATHMDLFGLPGDDGEYPVVPYEANYTVREDIGQQQRRIAKVAGAVEALGFEFDDDFDERHDHVAVELELLQVLAGWRAVAAESGDEENDAELARIEAMLLADHLVDFVPSLATALTAATEHDVYASAAMLAKALVTRDHARHADVDRPAPERAGAAASDDTDAEPGDTTDAAASADGGDP